MSLARWAPIAKGERTMRGLDEITQDGDIISDDGEVYSLFTYDPESLGEEPIE
jgi:hypothetical protein